MRGRPYNPPPPPNNHRSGQPQKELRATGTTHRTRKPGSLGQRRRSTGTGPLPRSGVVARERRSGQDEARSGNRGPETGTGSSHPVHPIHRNTDNHPLVSHHRGPILVPIRMLPGDPPVNLHQLVHDHIIDSRSNSRQRSRPLRHHIRPEIRCTNIKTGTRIPQKILGLGPLSGNRNPHDPIREHITHVRQLRPSVTLQRRQHTLMTIPEQSKQSLFHTDIMRHERTPTHTWTGSAKRPRQARRSWARGRPLATTRAGHVATGPPPAGPGAATGCGPASPTRP